VWKHSYARFNGFLPLLCEKCGLATLPCPAGPFDKLAARWRSRITVGAGFLLINAHERAHLWHDQSQ
jgi:hypothetical protein